MSEKSGASPRVISLPQGGGALKGLGETFAPDEQTGTGTFSLPIAIPSGRSGFQPDLKLEYSTGNANGPFGMGWRLGIPEVSRKTARGVPRYGADAEADTFLLSGAEDLVPVAPAAAGEARYRPRTEGLFARILHQQTGNSDLWVMQSQDGLTSRFGTPRPAGSSSGWRDPATVAAPGAPDRIFAWYLTESVDQHGNRIEYTYEPDPGAVEYDQVYLKEIRYLDHGSPAALAFLVAVRFMYDLRPDPFSDCRAGFEIRTTRRCQRIEVWSEGRLIKTYRFVYQDQRPGAPHLPANGASLLSQVWADGHDGTRNQSQAPLEFGYTAFAPELRCHRSLTAVCGDMPGRSLHHPEYEVVDLFGRGLPDIVEMNGTMRYWRNLGDGRLDLSRLADEVPAGADLARAGVQMADLDGDGRPDLLISDGTTAGYYPLNGRGGWKAGGFVRLDRAPALNLDDPEVRLVDLDGDGVTDAMRTGAHLAFCYFDPERGWTGLEQRERSGDEDCPDVFFSDPRVRLADLNGDGLQDMVLIHDGRVEYWPYMGYGRWGRRVVMANSPRFDDAAGRFGIGFDPQRLLVGDIDGDGLADLAYIGDGRLTVWINQSGNRWSDPVTIRGTPPMSNADAVRLIDLYGTGLAGLLWTYDYQPGVDSTYKYLDLTDGVKPYLLNRIDNQMGAVTAVEYAPSTRYGLLDEDDPQRRWRTTLPFAVQVVDRVRVTDHFSGGTLTKRYHYAHGYWDGEEREFRGFGRVDRYDAEEFSTAEVGGGATVPYSPPVLTRTWYHLGPVHDPDIGWTVPDFSGEFWSGDRLPAAPEPGGLAERAGRDAVRALRGRPLRSEMYGLDGTTRASLPYTVTEYTYDMRQEQAGVYFPFRTGERLTQWERGTDPMTRLLFLGDYDAYGHARYEIAVAVPRGRQYRRPAQGPAEPYLATLTRKDYAAPAAGGAYIHDRLARSTSWEVENDGRPEAAALVAAILGGSAPLRTMGQILHFYDGNAYEGLPWGCVGERGALVRSEELVLTETILTDAYPAGDPALGGEAQPPYFAAVAAPAWPAVYPPAFRSSQSASSGPLRPGLVQNPAGYGFSAGGQGSPFASGYFAATQRTAWDFQLNPAGSGRGLVRIQLDPRGNATQIVYDGYDLLPAGVTDAAGLTVAAAYDYGVFQPREVIDPNGNRTLFTYTPLGLPETIAVTGKPGEPVGDTPDQPGTRFLYDTLAYYNSPPATRKAVYAHTVRRQQHRWDLVAAASAGRAAAGQPPLTDAEVRALFPPDELARFPERFGQVREYSDGFGRVFQRRTQADDLLPGTLPFGDAGLPAAQGATTADAVARSSAAGNPWVTVTGWNVFDNKGQVVETYQPFFSSGWGLELNRKQGAKVQSFYDPRGKLVRAIHPDGAEERSIFGVPGTIAAVDLSNPDRYEPTPWETYAYDTNDSAGRTHAAQTAGYRHHWNTPRSCRFDALGRTAASVERNRLMPAGNLPLPPVEELVTRFTYDMRGNLLSVTDPRGVRTFSYVYDLSDRPLRTTSPDAGVRRLVLDAAGQEVERRDSKGALVLTQSDRLGRLQQVWTRDRFGPGLTLRERIEYGDGGDPLQPAAERSAQRACNRLNQVHRHYDEAGLMTCDMYDFKGNLLERRRQPLKDTLVAAVYQGAAGNDWRVEAFRVEWQPPQGLTAEQHAAALLGPSYSTSYTYDAEDRVVLTRAPAGVSGLRREVRRFYNRVGGLRRLELDGQPFIRHIAYNAKGQRLLVAYGNQLMTRFAYDRRYQVIRQRTELYTQPDPLRWHPAGGMVQDWAYTYDLNGNLRLLKDRSPGCGVPGSLLGADALDRAFEYDPLYRLVAANGRECDTAWAAPPWLHSLRGTDPTATRPYAESYRYDRSGNLVELRRQAGANAYVRTLAPGPSSNRLSQVGASGLVFQYRYDANGNMVHENLDRHSDWDHADRLKTFRVQTPASGAALDDDRWSAPTVHAQYFYDGAGHRIMKLVRDQGGSYEVTVFIDEVFEHVFRVGTGALENFSTHLMDGETRVARVRDGTPLPGDNSPPVQYHLGDHLGSSALVTDQTGAWVNREEFSPFGETTFGSFALKRYRFTGKERDEESGFYYAGARYYAPWLVRWVSCDPLGRSGSNNLYAYVSGNPLRWIDPLGLAESPPLGSEGQLPVISPTPPPIPDNPALDVQMENGVMKVRIKGFDKLYVGWAENVECYQAARSSVRQYTKKQLVEGAYRPNPDKASRYKSFPNLSTRSSGPAGPQFDPAKAQEVLGYIRETVDKGLPVIIGVDEGAGGERTYHDGTDHYLDVYGYDMELVSGKWQVTRLYGMDNAYGDISGKSAAARALIRGYTHPVLTVQPDGRVTKPGDPKADRAYKQPYEMTHARIYKQDFQSVKKLHSYHGPQKLVRWTKPK